MSPENWKTIDDFPDYEASSFGNIRSKDRFVDMGRDGWPDMFKRGKAMVLYLKKNGYLQVALYKNKKIHHVSVHKIILLCFISQRPSKTHVCNHKDGCKTNNSISNLEWVTPSENAIHAIETGLYKIKLTKSKICELLSEYATGEYTQTQIALKFHVDPSTINKILVNRPRVIKEDDWVHISNKINKVRAIKPKRKGKFSDDEIIQIRALYSSKSYTLNDIAKKFSMSFQMVSLIVNNKCYKDITL